MGFNIEKGKGSTLSSLRIESLRLAWLEAFVKVANSENISAAARDMGIDQSTVSRYLQAIQKWLGKDLIVLGGIHDEEEAGRNVALTDEGREFYEIANEVIPRLVAFRSEHARRDELLDDMSTMVGKMVLDLNGKHPSRTVQSVRVQLADQVKFLEALHENGPLELVEPLNKNLRRFFATYEDKLKRERKIGRRGGRR